jgi:adenine-specific DNA glycosylase
LMELLKKTPCLWRDWFWCIWVVVVMLQSFDVHSVFLWFFRHLNFNPLLFSPV